MNHTTLYINKVFCMKSIEAKIKKKLFRRDLPLVEDTSYEGVKLDLSLSQL